MRVIDFQKARNTGGYGVDDAILEFRIAYDESAKERVNDLYALIKHIYNNYLAGSFPYVSLRLYRNNVFYKQIKYSEANYHKYEAMFHDGEIEEFILVGSKGKNEEIMGGLSITCDPHRYIKKDNINGIIYKEPVGQIDSSRMNKITELFLRLHKEYNVINSYMTISKSIMILFSQMSFLEMYGTEYSYDNLKRRLRGAYWANVINENIINTLGGVDQITRESPCKIIRELNNKNGKQVLLQLTEDIYDCQLEELMELKRYLDRYNLLPKINLNYHELIKNLPNSLDKCLFFEEDYKPAD